MQEFEQALGDGKGQGSLAGCSPWGRKELDMTEQLNNRPQYLKLKTYWNQREQELKYKGNRDYVQLKRELMS